MQGEEISLNIPDGTAVQNGAVRQFPAVVGGAEDLGEGGPAGLVLCEAGRLWIIGVCRQRVLPRGGGVRSGGRVLLFAAGGQGQEEAQQEKRGVRAAHGEKSFLSEFDRNRIPLRETKKISKE